MMSQESFHRPRHGVIPVEIALVGEAVDLRLGDFYQGKVDPAALPRAMCLHPCRGEASVTAASPFRFGAVSVVVFRV